MNAWLKDISHEIDVCMEWNADFNILKIHLMSHWDEQIHQYGALQQYSAARHEEAHIKNLQDGWNAYYHNLNYLPQVITFHRWILCWEIWELNIQALVQHQEKSAAMCEVLPSCTDLAAPLITQSYLKPEIMGPQNGHDGKYLTLWSKTSDHYLRICKAQRTTWQYITARGCLPSIRVVIWCLYRMNNCTQRCSVFPIVLRFKLRVYMVNAYLRCANAQEASAGMEGIDRTTGCG